MFSLKLFFPADLLTRAKTRQVKHPMKDAKIAPCLLPPTLGNNNCLDHPGPVAQPPTQGLTPVHMDLGMANRYPDLIMTLKSLPKEDH